MDQFGVIHFRMTNYVLFYVFFMSYQIEEDCCVLNNWLTMTGIFGVI